MSKNVKIDGRECSGISSIQAFDVDTNEYVSFVDTSDATATADDILKDKTAYVNGEKVIGTGAGGGGDQPVMNAPTISLSGRQLTMTNPSTNGNFFSKFKVFVDNTLKIEQTETTIDLYTYFNEDGTYNLAAKCAGANFQDSEASNSVRYTKFTPTSGVVWYGNDTALSQARAFLAATTVGNYALFGGGIGSSDSDVVDAYDENLTRIIPNGLSKARLKLSATTVGNYALFGGGDGGVVDAYDTNLTRTTPTALSVARSNLVATTVGNYALFGGDYSNNVVDAYDTNLTRTTPTALSEKRGNTAATTVGNYALFGGGYYNYSYKNTVDAYDENLTRTTPTALSAAANSPSATTVGDYALFAGGENGNNSCINSVNAYDTNLTRTTPTALSVARSNLVATTLGNYALFGGGEKERSDPYIAEYVSVVDAYDIVLTRSIPTGLSNEKIKAASTTIGNYALFGGGQISSGIRIDTVDVYMVK